MRAPLLRQLLPALAGLAGLFAGSQQTASAQAIPTFVARFVDQYTLNPPAKDGVVFLGSSSIRRWERLTIDFEDYEVIQRGLGGARLDDLEGWVDEVVAPYDPSAVVIYGGSNGISPPEPPDSSGDGAGTEGTTQNTPQEEFQFFLDLVDAIHAQQNQAKAPIPVIYIGITPTPARWGLWPDASQVNALVQTHAQTDPDIWFVETAPIFLATGSPPSGFYFDPDMNHLNQLGYDVWATEIRTVLENALAPNKTWSFNPARPAQGTRVLVDLGPGDGTNGNQTSSPDLNGNAWNSWYAIPGGDKVLAGESLGNLVATDGTPTGFDLVLTGGWKAQGLQSGGLTNPDPALLGRFAIASATQDFFFTDSSDDPAGFWIDGLDPRRRYHLRFFASRNAAAPLVTRYAVSGGGATRVADLQSSGSGLGATSNQNDATVAVLRGLRPDRFGRLFVDASPGAGAAAFLNLLEIEVGPRIWVDRSGPISTGSVPARRRR